MWIQGYYYMKRCFYSSGRMFIAVTTLLYIAGCGLNPNIPRGIEEWLTTETAPITNELSQIQNSGADFPDNLADIFPSGLPKSMQNWRLIHNSLYYRDNIGTERYERVKIYYHALNNSTYSIDFAAEVVSGNVYMCTWFPKLAEWKCGIKW